MYEKSIDPTTTPSVLYMRISAAVAVGGIECPSLERAYLAILSFFFFFFFFLFFFWLCCSYFPF